MGVTLDCVHAFFCRLQNHAVIMTDPFTAVKTMSVVANVNLTGDCKPLRFFYSCFSLFRSQGTRWRPSILPPSLGQTYYTSWRAPTRNSACRARHGPRKARLSSPCCRGWSPATRPFSWLVSDEQFWPQVLKKPFLPKNSPTAYYAVFFIDADRWKSI